MSEALNNGRNPGVTLSFGRQFHPLMCPNRGDGKHTERDGNDLGELVYDAERESHVCLDCDYTQAHVLLIQSRRYQAAKAIERLEAWCKSTGAAIATVIPEGDAYKVALTTEDKPVSRGKAGTLSEAIHAALDAWESRQ